MFHIYLLGYFYLYYILRKGRLQYLGQEGLQAARAADYTLPGFKGLGRLLLVHGRNAYYRTSLVVLYSFYKSFAFCAIQLGEWGGMRCVRTRIARHG